MCVPRAFQIAFTYSLILITSDINQIIYGLRNILINMVGGYGGGLHGYARTACVPNAFTYSVASDQRYQLIF